MNANITSIETILYVENQELSAEFYKAIFRREPDLNVPGMTEFNLADNFKLGLMPNSGIAKILKDTTPNPGLGIGIPRCELYLCVGDIELEFANAIRAGAKLVSGIEPRNWGDKVCYFADPDGHIIAFAEKA